MRSPALAAALSLGLSAAPLACTDRPILDTYEGATDGSDTATTASTGPETTTGISTSSPTTVGPTSGPTTSPSTSATTSDPTTATTGVFDVGFGFCGDFWCSPIESCESCPQDCGCSLPAGLTGCAYEWGYSNVYGYTPLGELYTYAAMFAWEGFGDQSWSTLNLHFYDGGVDLQEALAGGPFDSEHFGVHAFTSRPYNEWVSVGDSYAYVARDFKTVDTEITVIVDGKLGSWDFYNPNDPARLYGYILDANDDDVYLDGYFEAVFCDQLVSWVIPE